jgi:hypothetical protein
MRCRALVSRRRTSRTTPTSVRPFDADVGRLRRSGDDGTTVRCANVTCGAAQARTRRT